MKKSIRQRLIYYSLSFLVIGAFMAEGIREAVTFNHTAQTEELPDSYLFPKTEDVTLDAVFEDATNDTDKTSWNVAINVDEKENRTEDEQNYKSVYQDLHITNISNQGVNSYKVRITADKRCYFLTGWCGTFEFHQFRDDKELTAVVDYSSGNIKSKDAYNLDMTTSVNGSDYIVTLRPGDYILYIPSIQDGFASIDPDITVTPGMIFYESIDEGCTFSASQELSTSSDAATDTVYTIDVKVDPRNDSWNKILDPDNEGLTEPDYFGETYNIIYTNDAKYTLKNYTVTYTATKEMYLSSMWNGSVEIHQGDKVAYIKDLRDYDADETGLTILEAGSETLIPLSEGDYFIYTPSSEECPLKAYQSTNTGFIVYLKLGETLGGTITVHYYLFRSLWTTPLLLVAVIFLIIWLLFLVFDGLLYLRLKTYMKQKEHDEKMITEAIETFTGFIDAKDPYTNGHSRRVAYYTRLLADKMGYSEEDQKRIYYIALLHDCGKIGIPDSILCKPSKLTNEEFDVIKSHPVRGEAILKNFTSIEHVRDGVLYHHERYDGKGYPEGLKGEDIPLDARIICVADSFDAMNSNRCYRKKLSKEDIINEFERCKGTQFDPEIAEAMMVLIASGKINIEE